MTKKKAIELAKGLEIDTYSYVEDIDMWRELSNPQNRSTLKRRRIERALILLGLDHDDVSFRVQCTQEFDGMSFRQAVYSTEIK